MVVSQIDGVSARAILAAILGGETDAATLADLAKGRLRAKLGPENESLIGTVRNVGYRFVLPPVDRSASEETEKDRESVVSD